MIHQIPGLLEVDDERGVIYFHRHENLVRAGQQPTALRICSLPHIKHDFQFIDVTHMYGVSVQ